MANSATDASQNTAFASLHTVLHIYDLSFCSLGRICILNRCNGGRKTDNIVLLESATRVTELQEYRTLKATLHCQCLINDRILSLAQHSQLSTKMNNIFKSYSAILQRMAPKKCYTYLFIRNILKNYYFKNHTPVINKGPNMYWHMYSLRVGIYAF